MFLKRKNSSKILIVFIFLFIFGFRFAGAALPSSLQDKFTLLKTQIETLIYDFKFLELRIKHLKKDQIEELEDLLQEYQILIAGFQKSLVGFFSPKKCLKLWWNVDKFRCINDLALLTGDEEKCEIYHHPDFEFLSDSKTNYIENCYLYAAVGREDPSVCKRLTAYPYYGNESLCRDDYYKILAKEKKDISLCEKIQEGTRHSGCIENFVKLTGNLDLCEKIKEKLFRDWCYRDYATTLEGCDKASGISRDFCIERLAILSNNSSWCEKIEDEIIKDRCERKF
jgi:hypothetical protein